jgi:PAT family beta-lactamase induction signal transducer AmpG
MLFLGFSAGLPFYLLFQTLSAWLRQAGIQRSTIGMLAWVGIAYTLKFLWAPVIDRTPLPLLYRLFGRRRSWMLFAQAGIAVGLFNLSLSDPASSVTRIAAWAMFVAFWAATQDIAIDAWRIESAAVELQGAMAAAYQVGYRTALITGSAGAFALADRYGWHASYSVMALLVSVGVVTTLLIREPSLTTARQPAAPGRGAVLGPIVDFFSRYRGGLALAILAFIGTYRLTEYAMGSMANTFYIDRGYTLTQIATVVKLYGLSMSIAGVVLAGMLIVKLGLVRCLVLGSVLIALSNLGFAALAAAHAPSLLGLGLVNGLDNIAQAVHGTSLIAFLSSLTSPRYTATQYALFSSLYALTGKILEGTSGFVVDAIGYPAFFCYTAALSLPGLLLIYGINRSRARPVPT